MIIPKEFINYNNKLYWIYRKVNQTSIKENSVQDVKTFWNCDMVVKHKNQDTDILLFLVEIPELEIVETPEVELIN